MTSVNAEQAMTIVGAIGGLAISLSLVPQVYLTYKTKCADDISYTYQFIYIFGTTLVNAYAIYFHLYAVYIPCLLEFMLIVTLTVMKIIYPPRQDLLDYSRHSLKLHEMGSKGCLMSANLHILQQMLNNHEEVAADDGEVDKNLLRKSIALLKCMTVHVERDFDMEAEADTEKGQNEILDFSTQTKGTEMLDFSAKTGIEEDENCETPTRTSPTVIGMTQLGARLSLNMSPLIGSPGILQSPSSSKSASVNMSDMSPACISSPGILKTPSSGKSASKRVSFGQIPAHLITPEEYGES